MLIHMTNLYLLSFQKPFDGFLYAIKKLIDAKIFQVWFAFQLFFFFIEKIYL